MTGLFLFLVQGEAGGKDIRLISWWVVYQVALIGKRVFGEFIYKQ